MRSWKPRHRRTVQSAQPLIVSPSVVRLTRDGVVVDVELSYVDDEHTIALYVANQPKGRVVDVILGRAKKPDRRAGEGARYGWKVATLRANGAVWTYDDEGDA
jgi:hypothetical protein